MCVYVCLLQQLLERTGNLLTARKEERVPWPAAETENGKPASLYSHSDLLTTRKPIQILLPCTHTHLDIECVSVAHTPEEARTL